jgi:DNA-binding transcriptional MerR regulator
VSTPYSGSLRIGELSRRLGVSVTVLRAWERRYGLFSPRRSPAGYRLYDTGDERRGRAMLAYMRRGLAAAESARLAQTVTVAPPDALRDLVSAWRRHDVTTAHRALDILLTGPEPEVAVCRFILPQLVRLPDADAHLARGMLETRLLVHAERWHEGTGPLALLGCALGDQRVVRPIACGLALHRRGWRVAYLGAGASLASFASVTEGLRPDHVVLAAAGEARTEDLAHARRIAATSALWIASDGLTPAPGARLLDGDPLDWALALSR